MNHLRWMWPFLKGRKLLLGLVALLSLVQMLASFGGTYLQRGILDGLRTAGLDGSTPASVLPLLVLFYTIHAVLIFGSPFVSLHLYAGLRLRLFRRLLEALRLTPLQTLQSRRTVDFIHLFIHHIHLIAFAFSDRFLVLSQNLVLAIALCGYMLWAFPLFAVPLLVLSYVYVRLGAWFGRKRHESTGRIWEARNRLGALLEEGISSVREMTSFHRYAWDRERYQQQFDAYLETIEADAILENRRLYTSESLQWAMRLFTLLTGGYLVLQGQWSVGTYVVAYLFADQWLSSIQAVFIAGTDLAGHLKHVEIVREYTDPQTIPPSAKSIPAPSPGGSRIEASGLRFTFEGRSTPTLQGLDFVIEPGCTLGVAGASGSGKSTLIQLIIGLYDPDEGEILVDGGEPPAKRPGPWNNRAAVVLQEPYLFHDTLRNNIVMGRETGPAELQRVCRAAQLECVIDELPDGLDTRIGERGITLSGGQRQRVALARALLGRPALLILDEATSALDLETERRLLEALASERAGMTTVMIAHRLSTIRQADWLLVLDQGRLAEQGTHDSLISGDTLYRRLVESQRLLHPHVDGGA